MYTISKTACKIMADFSVRYNYIESEINKYLKRKKNLR